MQIRVTLASACGLVLFAASAMAGASALNQTDRQFMISVARTDMTEAHEGQLAENQATRSDLKDFAKTLAQDHTESYEELGQLAAKAGVSIPKGIDIARNQAAERLIHLKGNRFDSAFERDEIASHRRAIAAFKHEAKYGENADVKAWAAKTIPVLEKHLQMAEQCAKTVRSS